ncbi:uncharacterized protein SAMN05192574_10759 [Mucilaginibacter gossypiicola]|uniref:DUF418 domain-containing protein n=1 Tax=Mucilaginibacter gossypiicola TaxID=551995 RepID=A0A1H8NR36_9SPHI|nr:DUF418 domain-containing protein [Mucilaginibacter gossypiicola]SEO32019.1 uncharacterized protein SAMN05192574_10759 [Mucilaginibacter gossypiicola]
MDKVIINTDQQEKTANPVAQNKRIILLDAMRGIAVLGILVMNIMEQGQPGIFYMNMNAGQSQTGSNFFAWLFGMGLFEGVMRGMFCILFGVGSLLLLDRLEQRGIGLKAADIFYRRMLWLLALGLLNAFVFLWPGDILYDYALIGLTLFPFRRMSASRLMIPITILLLFGIYRESSQQNDTRLVIEKGKQAEELNIHRHALTPEQNSDLTAFQKFKTENSNPGMVVIGKEASTAVQSANLSGLLKIIYDQNIDFESTFFYNHWWDIALLFFTGMAFYRSGFITGESKTWIYIVVASGGLIITLVMNYYDLMNIYNNKFDFVKITESASPVVFYQAKRLLQVAAYLSALILLYRLTSLRNIFKVFANVGQMALTNYLMQSIITSIIFFGFGFYGKLQRYELIEAALLIWIFQIILSAIWLRYFTYGPFEWAWRSLTYLKTQPFKRR